MTTERTSERAVRQRLAGVLIPFLWAAVAGAANVFTGDPNCKALWRFESVSTFSDSIGGNAWDASTPSPVADAVNYKEGAASVDFESSSSHYLYISDAELDAGFPLKNGDLNKRISVAGWLKLESLPATSKWFRVFHKSDPGNLNSLYTGIFTDASNHTWFYLGIGTGASVEWLKFAGAEVVAARWYHFGVTFQNSDKSYRIRIWDDTAGALLGGAEQTGTTANNIYVGTGTLYLGIHNDASTGLYDGLMDEIVVFNDILTAAEIDKIRQGTFGAAPKGQVVFVEGDV